MSKSLIAGWLGSIALASSAALGQTRLHSDLGGVTTRAGNVWISARVGGHVTTSTAVGRYRYHNSNRGLSGVSYYSAHGRFDFLNDTKHRRSKAAYTPYNSYRFRIGVDRGLVPGGDLPAAGFSHAAALSGAHSNFLLSPPVGPPAMWRPPNRVRVAGD